MSPHSHLTPEWIDWQLSRSCPNEVPQQDEEHFDMMIDNYNEYTKGPCIYRRINPNWEYKESVLRKTRGDKLYWHTLYSQYRPELFDWEKALDGKKGQKLRSLAGTSRLDFKECATRKVRLKKQSKEFKEKTDAEVKAYLLQCEKEATEKKDAEKKATEKKAAEGEDVTA
ncbi:hypothetical protein SLS62_009632 [Diatrype stigma]|uniref:Uncharacterized protein n=1 Tax=Diatrype stigma TaxID=117547 RepID=A0AAN9UD56_9PEZI